MGVTFEPIGVVRTPFTDKKDAPRQPAAARGVRGRVELIDSAEMRDAVCDLEAWTHLWIVYVFHERGEGWSPKVQPPRSDRRRGVLATRSPHRPNPIGLSALRVTGVTGHTVHVLGLDLLDETPILDIKPYVPYADAFPGAAAGWLDELEGPIDGPDRPTRAPARKRREEPSDNYESGRDRAGGEPEDP